MGEKNRILTMKGVLYPCKIWWTLAHKRLRLLCEFWSNLCNFSIFTALHVMQTRYCDEISLRPSVCPSVCLSATRVNCDKTVERSVQIYIPYERTFILVFWEDRMVGGGDPFYLKFWVNRPPLERNRRFSTNNRS